MVRIRVDKSHQSIATPYKMKTITVNAKNINDFQRLVNARKLREEELGSIKAALFNGEHFASPLVVNKQGDKLRVIDGNHRLQAIINWIANSERSIDVDFAVYENLSDAQEIEVYSLWNKGTKQSLDDRINVMRDQIPIIEEMLDKGFFACPVTIYPVGLSAIGLHFRTLLKAYFFANKPWDSLSTAEFMSWVQKLDDRDVMRMNEVVKDFQSVFGKPGQANRYCNSNFLKVYFRLNSQCAKLVGRKVFNERMAKYVYNDPVVLDGIARFTHREDLVRLAQDVCDKANKGISKENNKIDWRVEDMVPKGGDVK